MDTRFVDLLPDKTVRLTSADARKGPEVGDRGERCLLNWFDRVFRNKNTPCEAIEFVSNFIRDRVRAKGFLSVPFWNDMCATGQEVADLWNAVMEDDLGYVQPATPPPGDRFGGGRVVLVKGE